MKYCKGIITNLQIYPSMDRNMYDYTYLEGYEDSKCIDKPDIPIYSTQTALRVNTIRIMELQNVQLQYLNLYCKKIFWLSKKKIDRAEKGEKLIKEEIYELLKTNEEISCCMDYPSIDYCCEIRIDCGYLEALRRFKDALKGNFEQKYSDIYKSDWVKQLRKVPFDSNRKYY